MIQAYRKITGACASGVKHFTESIDAPDELTVKEVIELTQGRFGSDEFSRFFCGNE
jgi:hypothetical protein